MSETTGLISGDQPGAQTWRSCDSRPETVSSRCPDILRTIFLSGPDRCVLSTQGDVEFSVSEAGPILHREQLSGG